MILRTNLQLCNIGFHNLNFLILSICIVAWIITLLHPAASPSPALGAVE
jgi:hypothetical protein